MENIRYIPASDSALIVSLGEDVDETVNQRVIFFWEEIGKSSIKGIIEAVPTYRDLCICYDPLEITAGQLIEECNRVFNSLNDTFKKQSSKKVREVPVVYGGNYGLDLGYVAQAHDMTPQEVIDLHSSTVYRVYMVGFAPGFPYLGDLHEKLHTPRREVVNPRVPAGSVGIGGQQTGVLTITSPSGWWFIGRTPLGFWDLEKDDPVLVKPGDYIKFKAIRPEEFELYSAEGRK